MVKKHSVNSKKGSSLKRRVRNKSEQSLKSKANVQREKDYQEELKIKRDIRDEILDFIAFRNDFFILEDGGIDYLVVAKFTDLTIKNTFNKHGFQPVESITDKKECLIRIISVGGDPERNTLAYMLKKGGCPVVKINNKFEVESKMMERA